MRAENDSTADAIAALRRELKDPADDPDEVLVRGDGAIDQHHRPGVSLYSSISRRRRSSSTTPRV